MNFRGQYRRGRNINLGGKNSSAVSKDSVLKKAQEERERREKLRVEERAAIRIQRYFRSKQALYKARVIARSQWINFYSNRVDLDTVDMIQCVDLLAFASRSLYRSGSDAMILEKFNHLITRSAVNLSSGHLTNLLDALSPVVGRIYTNYGETDSGFSSMLAIIAALASYMPKSMFSICGSIASLELERSGRSLILDSVQALEHVVDRFPAEFVKDYLSIADLGICYADFLSEGLDMLSKSHVDLTSIPSSMASLDTSARLWVLTNASLGTTRMPPSLFLISFLTQLLASVGFIIDNRMDDETQYEEAEPVTGPLRVSLQTTSQQKAISNLYSRAFVLDTFSLLSTEDDRSRTISVLGYFFASLIAFCPSKRSDILLYLSVTSSESIPAVYVFWQSFKSSEIFHKFLNGILDTKSILSLDSSDLTWSKLILTLQLYSYWLIVADDSDFLTNTSHGLSKDEVTQLAILLKNICYSLIWNWTQLENATVDMYNLLKKLKGVSLSVIRQIYLRDSRRPFLEADFWLMTDNFNMDVFIPMVVEEHERQKEQEESEDETSTVDIRKRQVANRQQLAPRLELLRQVPFFMPFDVRVHIFQAFIELDRAQLHQNGFDEFFRLGGDLFGDPINRSRVHVEIHRENLLSDAYDAFHGVSSQDFKFPIAVTFVNEHGVEAGIDGGGLTKEFLTSVCHEGFINGGDDLELFESTRSHQLYPNPIYGVSKKLSELDSKQVERALGYYAFLGRVIGKCLYEQILVDTEFAPFFLQKWAIAGGKSDKNTFDDLYSLDPEIYNNLVKVLKYNGDIENDLNLDFTIVQEVGHGIQKTVELKPDGTNIPVTNTNKLEYIHAIANYKLNSVVAPQTGAFLQGVSSIISLDWLSMFNASELQMLISGGQSKIDLEDLQNNVNYLNGYHKQHPTIIDFWNALKEMTEEDRRNFVKFVSSVPKAPLLGFKQLNPKFAIINAGTDISRLPTASTCVNMLKLPDYRNKSILKDKLLYSIHAEAGFDLS